MALRHQSSSVEFIDIDEFDISVYSNRYSYRLRDTNQDPFVIKCEPGSFAQEYARKNCVKFEKANVKVYESPNEYTNEYTLDDSMLILVKTDYISDAEAIDSLDSEVFLDLEKYINSLGYNCLYFNRNIIFDCPIKKEDENIIKEEISNRIGNKLYCIF